MILYWFCIFCSGGACGKQELDVKELIGHYRLSKLSLHMRGKNILWYSFLAPEIIRGLMCSWFAQSMNFRIPLHIKPIKLGWKWWKTWLLLTVLSCKDLLSAYWILLINYVRRFAFEAHIIYRDTLRHTLTFDSCLFFHFVVLSFLS